jgi:hypothetical protein
VGKHRKVRFDVVVLECNGVSHWEVDHRLLPPRPPRCYHRITITNQETGESERVFDHRFVVN